jgi:hypothetical protein
MRNPNGGQGKYKALRDIRRFSIMALKRTRSALELSLKMKYLERTRFSILVLKRTRSGSALSLNDVRYTEMTRSR